MKTPSAPALPSNVNTEKNLISCLIQKPDYIRSLDITPELFSREQLRRIFIVMAEMDENGIPIDPATVSEEIRKKKWESFCGSASDLEELYEVAPTPRNAPHYTETLSRIALSRKILLKLKEVQDHSDDPEAAAIKLSEILDLARKSQERKTDIVTVASQWSALESLHETGKKRGLSSGWPSLDPYFTIRKGDLTIGTGIPGAGKSSFFDNIAVNMAKDHDWRTLYYSAENFPVSNHLANLLEILMGLPFNPGPHRRMDAFELKHSREFMESHFIFLDPDIPTVDRILSLAASIHKESPLDQLIIDPWNQLEHDLTSFSETQVIARSLAKIRRFARHHQIHVIVVAHPMKLMKDRTTGSYPLPTLYDIAGSAHFRNMADNGIVLFRQPDSNEVDVHIQKIRFREVGKLGSITLRYDRITGRFYET